MSHLKWQEKGFQHEVTGQSNHGKGLKMNVLNVLVDYDVAFNLSKKNYDVALVKSVSSNEKISWIYLICGEFYGNLGYLFGECMITWIL